mmetsp:Transcript_104147/g.301281  ORF Transcript_104147/g.301281 Transcript_104147/m.301281 type:complete len:344 (-) Transcript_104147:20-1051(-)
MSGQQVRGSRRRASRRPRPRLQTPRPRSGPTTATTPRARLRRAAALRARAPTSPQRSGWRCGRRSGGRSGRSSRSSPRVRRAWTRRPSSDSQAPRQRCRRRCGRSSRPTQRGTTWRPTCWICGGRSQMAASTASTSPASAARPSPQSSTRPKTGFTTTRRRRRPCSSSGSRVFAAQATKSSDVGGRRRCVRRAYRVSAARSTSTGASWLTPERPSATSPMTRCRRWALPATSWSSGLRRCRRSSPACRSMRTQCSCRRRCRGGATTSARWPRRSSGSRRRRRRRRRRTRPRPQARARARARRRRAPRMRVRRARTIRTPSEAWQLGAFFLSELDVAQGSDIAG